MRLYIPEHKHNKLPLSRCLREVYVTFCRYHDVPSARFGLAFRLLCCRAGFSYSYSRSRGYYLDSPEFVCQETSNHLRLIPSFLEIGGNLNWFDDDPVLETLPDDSDKEDCNHDKQEAFGDERKNSPQPLGGALHTRLFPGLGRGSFRITAAHGSPV